MRDKQAQTQSIHAGGRLRWGQRRYYASAVAESKALINPNALTLSLALREFIKALRDLVNKQERDFVEFV